MRGEDVEPSKTVWARRKEVREVREEDGAVEEREAEKNVAECRVYDVLLFRSSQIKLRFKDGKSLGAERKYATGQRRKKRR